MSHRTLLTDGPYPPSPEAIGRMSAHVDLLAAQLKRFMFSAIRLLPPDAPFDMRENEYLVWRDCEEAEALLKRCGLADQIPCNAEDPDWVALQQADEEELQQREER